MSRRNACDEQSKSDAEVKAVTSATLVKGSSAERLRKQTGSLFVFIVWEKHSVCLQGRRASNGPAVPLMRHLQG